MNPTNKSRKITFKEMKRRGMPRTAKKNEIILTCPSANRLRSARLKISNTNTMSRQLLISEKLTREFWKAPNCECSRNHSHLLISDFTRFAQVQK